MARGSTSSQGRAAKSELSERLRRNADALRRKNEDEKKEVEETETEYNDVLEQQYIRLQEELSREMKDRKWSVDQQEQAKRELEAKKAEMEAEAEETREKAVKQAWESKQEQGSDAIGKATKKIADDFLNLDGKSLNPDITKPQIWSGNFERKWMDKAPEELKGALQHLFESTEDDRFDLEKAMQIAYGAGSGGRDSDFYHIPKKFDNIPDDKEHQAGIKTMAKFEKFVRKMLVATTEKDNRFDENGNERG
jgi:hypothetical protein